MCNKVADAFAESIRMSVENERRPGQLADKANNPNTTTNGAGYAAGYRNQGAKAVPIREQLETKKHRLLKELFVIEAILCELSPEVEQMLRVKENLENLEKIRHGLLY